jgi:hypothetical protein
MSNWHGNTDSRVQERGEGAGIHQFGPDITQHLALSIWHGCVQNMVVYASSAGRAEIKATCTCNPEPCLMCLRWLVPLTQTSESVQHCCDDFKELLHARRHWSCHSLTSVREARLQGLRDNMKMENWHAHGFSTCLSSESIRKSWSGARGWGKSNFSGSYCTTLIIFSALSESVGQNSECEWFRSCTVAIWLPFSQLAPLLMLSEHQPRANLTCILSMALWKLSRVPLGWWRGVPPWIDKRW